jgi:two-component system cell cycle response regulator DivK
MLTQPPYLKLVEAEHRALPEMNHRNPLSRRGRVPPLVLVADDEDDMRALVAACLRRAGYLVAEARDGASAIEQARTLLPSAILLDLEMPIIDGCAAARTLKSDPATSSIPILCFTGSAAGADRARALEAGCEAFLDKPATGEVLLAALGRVLDGGARAPRR